MTIQRNQAPAEIPLFDPGIHRRVALIVDRGDESNLVPGTHVTMDELHQYQLLGRQLQARAMASALTDLFRAVLQPVKKLASAVKRQPAAKAATGQVVLKAEDRQAACNDPDAKAAA